LSSGVRHWVKLPQSCRGRTGAEQRSKVLIGTPNAKTGHQKEVTGVRAVAGLRINLSPPQVVLFSRY